jgi:nucleoside-triphosphatase
VKNLFITGNPGVGKTTLIKKIAKILPPNQFSGFYTEEIRAGSRRTGFLISTFDDYRKTMSHVDFNSNYQVGKYFVNIENIDEIVVRIQNAKSEPKLYLIDEIGKMESFSLKFRRWIEELMRGKTPILATIAKSGNEWIQSIKDFSGFQIIEITPENRNSIGEELQNEISINIIS